MVRLLPWGGRHVQVDMRDLCAVLDAGPMDSELEVLGLAIVCESNCIGFEIVDNLTPRAAAQRNRCVARYACETFYVIWRGLALVEAISIATVHPCIESKDTAKKAR